MKSPAACFTRFGEISGELVENFRRAYGSVRDSRLPTRSALNGAHRAPAPPDEGSCVPVARVQDRPERKRRPLRKAFHRKPFLPSCVCWRRTRPWGAGLTCRFGRRRAFATGKLRPTPCKPFEKGLTENFMLALPWFFLHLSSSGTYFWSTGKARYAGRIIRPPVVSSSMRWAHQPAMRLTANMGVNKSSGMPSISYTSPE